VYGSTYDVSLTLGATKRIFNTSSRFGTTWPRRRRREYIARENHTSSPLSLSRDILRARYKRREQGWGLNRVLSSTPLESAFTPSVVVTKKKIWRQLGSSNPKRLFALSNVCDIFASSVNKMIIIALNMFNCIPRSSITELCDLTVSCIVHCSIDLYECMHTNILTLSIRIWFNVVEMK